MNKGTLSNFLRNIKLIYWVDWLRFYVQKFNNRKVNCQFKKEHPLVKLPPDYLIYESFQIHYNKYYTESKATAEWLKSYWQKYILLQNIKVLDWGCGPGRVIRHLPEVVGEENEYHGTDYNAGSIQWCKDNLSGIQFNCNSLEARLPYEDGYFDVIYGISIFTHMSEQLHHDWYLELYRILKPGGIMFLTTHGDNFLVKLDTQEQQRYIQGQLIVRGKVKEGHRTFAAFHPTSFMQSLFQNVQILEHVVTPPTPQGFIPQDIWMVRK